MRNVQGATKGAYTHRAHLAAGQGSRSFGLFFCRRELLFACIGSCSTQATATFFLSCSLGVTSRCFCSDHALFERLKARIRNDLELRQHLVHIKAVVDRDWPWTFRWSSVPARIRTVKTRRSVAKLGGKTHAAAGEVNVIKLLRNNSCLRTQWLARSFQLPPRVATAFHGVSCVSTSTLPHHEGIK